MFSLMAEDDRHHPKEMVVGGRTAEAAGYFVLEELRDAGIQETEQFLAVYDPDLDTAHMYRKADDGADTTHSFTYEDGIVVGEEPGERYAPDELPLKRVIAIDAFFFAWNAFYPESEHP